MKKTIKVDVKTWKKLKEYQIKNDEKRLEDVIKKAIKGEVVIK